MFPFLVFDRRDKNDINLDSVLKIEKKSAPIQQLFSSKKISKMRDLVVKAINSLEFNNLSLRKFRDLTTKLLGNNTMTKTRLCFKYF